MFSARVRRRVEKREEIDQPCYFCGRPSYTERICYACGNKKCEHCEDHIVPMINFCKNESCSNYFNKEEER